MVARVAVVTGANKGIGYGIVKKMCQEFNGIVYLTARDETRGLAAVAKLQQEGVEKAPKFHQLDITDEASIRRLRDHLAETYNGLDVLINNAGIAYKMKSTVPFHEQATNTIKVDFTGTMNVCKALFPLLKPHGRVVNITAMRGIVKKITSQSLRNEFVREDLSEARLVELIQQFIDSTVDGTSQSKGWPQTAYGMAKIGVNALTRIQARAQKYGKDTDILINSCCPGHCITDMSSWKGSKSAAEGAETPVFLALLPPGQEQPHGKFYKDKKEASWTD